MAKARDQDETLPSEREVRPLAAWSEDGVDLTLIRWMLSLSPRERLETVQNTIRSILELRDAQSRT